MILAIISVSSFFAMTGAIKDTSLPWNEETSSDYFNAQEITAFGSVATFGNYSQPLYSDDYTVRDLYHLSDYSTRILTGGNITYIGSGYVILRSGELENRGMLLFSSVKNVLYSYKIDINNSTSNIILQLNPEERIYDDGAVQSYVIQR